MVLLFLTTTSAKKHCHLYNGRAFLDSEKSLLFTATSAKADVEKTCWIATFCLLLPIVVIMEFQKDYLKTWYQICCKQNFSFSF